MVDGRVDARTVESVRLGKKDGDVPLKPDRCLASTDFVVFWGSD